MSTEKVETKISKMGGKREGSGRKKGTPNKATADIKALAQQYGAEAIATLVNLMYTAENPQTKVAAAKELLDRGYGKSVQAIDASISGDMSHAIRIIFG